MREELEKPALGHVPQLDDCFLERRAVGLAMLRDLGDLVMLENAEADQFFGDIGLYGHIGSTLPPDLRIPTQS